MCGATQSHVDESPQGEKSMCGATQSHVDESPQGEKTPTQAPVSARHDPGIALATASGVMRMVDCGTMSTTRRASA
jgi:hypothetical protein